MKKLLRKIYIFLFSKFPLIIIILLKKKYRSIDYYCIYQNNRKKSRFTLSTIKFEDRYLQIPDLPSFAYQVLDIFVNNEYFFKSYSDTPLIYDCGSNIGISILYFKKKYPNSIIKAFEADKTIFEHLKTNLMGLQGISLNNVAVWDANEELSFNSEGADGGSLINTFDSNQNVQGIRLKEYLENETEVDFLKMDIEGAEYNVIKDCSSQLVKVRNLFIEYHSFIDQPQVLGEILSLLNNAGFRYHLQNLTTQKEPFIKRYVSNNMDMQINIYAYRP